MPAGGKQAAVWIGDGARLVDLGGEVACLRFHGPHHAVGPGIAEAIRRSGEEVERNWRGLVLAGDGKDFGIGLNLLLVFTEAENGDWDELDLLAREMQSAAVAIRTLRRPVVAAPHGRTFGAAAAICLAADRIVFGRDVRFGLTETEEGLVPAAGGCLAAALLAERRARSAGLADPAVPLGALFEAMMEAEVYGAQPVAGRIGYFGRGDLAVEPEERLDAAKRMVLQLAAAASQTGGGNADGCEPSGRVAAAGREAIAGLKLRSLFKRREGRWSDHDVKVAGKLAEAIAGGDVFPGTAVSEAYLLELEREAFLSLCGEPLTRARIRHRLATGERLRN
ncbi:enoyl-CoA hydratase-related protein [Cohnella candidum]|uniref:Enoyl-CoA hydratase/isomerase family protein n=1 Tax=Cohnella candidum TaxID=2674991 RepID=A0A3G3K3K3_9BACL|nr:enoyl-CoA hydratase-related protein [Cohnella candidum]AYQ75086.1 hypothetical protein EAV92_22540 [Cohnella candidum]